MVELIVMCLISQGSKGVYPTVMKAYNYSKTHYVTDSSPRVLSHTGKRNMLTINKKLCRVITEVQTKGD